MNLFQIYEGAIQNAKYCGDEIEFTLEYIKDYAAGAADVFLTDDQAAQILKAHNDWEESDKGSYNYDTLVKFELQDIQVA